MKEIFLTVLANMAGFGLLIFAAVRLASWWDAWSLKIVVDFMDRMVVYLALEAMVMRRCLSFWNQGGAEEMARFEKVNKPKRPVSDGLDGLRVLGFLLILLWVAALWGVLVMVFEQISLTLPLP